MIACPEILRRDGQKRAGQAEHRQQEELFHPQRHAVGRHRRSAEAFQIELHDKTGRHHHEHGHGDREHLLEDIDIGRQCRPEAGPRQPGHQFGAGKPVGHIPHDTGLRQHRRHRDAVEADPVPYARHTEDKQRVQHDIGKEGGDLRPLHRHRVALRLQQAVDEKGHDESRHRQNQDDEIAGAGIAIFPLGRDNLDQLGPKKPGQHHQQSRDDRPEADAPRRHDARLILRPGTNGVADKRCHRR